MGKMVAIDGEGIGRGRAHRYVYACSSEGDELEDVEGIGSAELAQWLLELRQKHRRATFVTFGCNYEAAQLCRGLNLGQLARLHDRSQVDVTGEHPYRQSLRISYVPSRFFGIAPLVFDKANRKWVYAYGDRAFREEGDLEAIRINDLMRFTQMSLVESMALYRIRDPRGVIARGKEGRSHFTARDMARLKRYCQQETLVIADLAERIADGIEGALGARPRMNGSGSVASLILRRTRVASERPEREEGSGQLEEALLRAYFGGRTETFRQGEFLSLTRYDLRSAYAWSVSQLPSARGRWRFTRRYEPNAPWAVWRCRWQVEDEELLYAPLPFRSRGEISYPLAGAGWYHAVELERALWRHSRGEIEVSSGYVFEPDDPDLRPFSQLEDVYLQRLDLKPGPAHTLKLGLAAVWGKLAQRDMPQGERTVRARYRNLFWAGAATALVRARMAELAWQLGDGRLVAQSTDALLIRGAPSSTVVASDAFGGVSVERLREALVVAANLYTGSEPDGSQTMVTSGFLSRAIDPDVLRRAWREGGPLASLEVGGQRMMGVGQCVLARDVEALGRFADWPQVLQFFQFGKDYWQLLGPTREIVLHPPARAPGRLSEPYDLRQPPLTDEPPEAEDEYEKSAKSGNYSIEGSGVEAAVTR